MHKQMLTITLQLVMLSGEGRGRGDTNLTAPTQHRQKWKKEPETYQTKEPDIEGLLQIPFWGRSNDIYFLHKIVPQKLHQGKKKTNSIATKDVASIVNHQIAVFLSPSDSFWPMKPGCCHLCHF